MWTMRRGGDLGRGDSAEAVAVAQVKDGVSVKREERKKQVWLGGN